MNENPVDNRVELETDPVDQFDAVTFASHELDAALHLWAEGLIDAAQFNTFMGL